MMKPVLLALSLGVGLAPVAALAAQVSGAGGRATDPRAVGIHERGVGETFERDRTKRAGRLEAKKRSGGKAERVKRNANEQ
jgi:hypothetical protein